MKGEKQWASALCGFVCHKFVYVKCVGRDGWMREWKEGVKEEEEERKPEGRMDDRTEGGVKERKLDLID